MSKQPYSLIYVLTKMRNKKKELIGAGEAHMCDKCKSRVWNAIMEIGKHGHSHHA